MTLPTSGSPVRIRSRAPDDDNPARFRLAGLFRFRSRCTGNAVPDREAFSPCQIRPESDLESPESCGRLQAVDGLLRFFHRLEPVHARALVAQRAVERFDDVLRSELLPDMHRESLAAEHVDDRQRAEALSVRPRSAESARRLAGRNSAPGASVTCRARSRRECFREWIRTHICSRCCNASTPSCDLAWPSSRRDRGGSTSRRIRCGGAARRGGLRLESRASDVRPAERKSAAGRPPKCRLCTRYSGEQEPRPRCNRSSRRIDEPRAPT